MNGTKTLWQQLACSAEETHDEESQEWYIGLKKLPEIKQQQQMWTWYTAAVTIMYNNVQYSHVERFKVRLTNSYEFNIFLNFLLSYILTNSSDIFFYFYSFLFQLSSLCVCRLAKPGCDSKRHYRGEITASQLDWHTLHQNICLIHFYITVFFCFFLNSFRPCQLNVRWLRETGSD